MGALIRMGALIGIGALINKNTFEARGGGYFPIRGYWGCAAGWGRIFTTGLTIMGLHF